MGALSSLKSRSIANEILAAHPFNGVRLVTYHVSREASPTCGPAWYTAATLTNPTALKTSHTNNLELTSTIARDFCREFVHAYIFRHNTSSKPHTNSVASLSGLTQPNCFHTSQLRPRSVGVRWTVIIALTTHLIPIFPPVLDEAGLFVYDEVPSGSPLRPTPGGRNSVVVRAAMRTCRSIPEGYKILYGACSSAHCDP